MPAAAPAVTFEDVARRYGAVAAVDGVSCRIEPGSFVALVGASGSGKSTLLKTVNRLVSPSAGRVLIDEQDVRDEPAPALRRRIGYVFQSIGLFPHWTVAENIGVGPRIARQAPADVARLLDMVDLPAGLAGRMPDELSGGQRQRVAIARALAPGARLLLLDEALGALDPVTRDALGRRLRALHDELALTTILVTHDMAEALLLATRVLVMKAGRIVADASPAELVNGGGGADAQALVRVPRDQAERLRELVG
ncbi:ATP-binding cassette domain-containing protein [Sphingomonas rubra]|uniref:Osmoprotectant transport system ATP-binding protein n=1 Tax=Sphingomonas rubra TaxID=634430 RepID=A0A1I5ULG2_9SPHN|nr:ATP-binding cassette domain-containing protein [Sphingomonas rubra]SFP95897.1 osmoprotectant transport system ATP-binding protein [Sphingomonas rubra]